MFFHEPNRLLVHPWLVEVHRRHYAHRAQVGRDRHKVSAVSGHVPAGRAAAAGYPVAASELVAVLSSFATIAQDFAPHFLPVAANPAGHIRPRSAFEVVIEKRLHHTPAEPVATLGWMGMTLFGLVYRAVPSWSNGATPACPMARVHFYVCVVAPGHIPNWPEFGSQLADTLAPRNGRIRERHVSTHCGVPHSNGFA